jgi:hypothetical protein
VKNIIKNFGQFINESNGTDERLSTCCGAAVNEDSTCAACGESAMAEFNDLMDDDDLYAAEAKMSRKSVLKAADKKYPNLEPASMKKTLAKMKDGDFKAKAEKYFGWADDPEAAAAAFIRKAAHKEPSDI